MSEEVEPSESIGMKQMLEAGVHFGHQKSHWNPKMKSFIFGIRNGIHIIDLQQTLGLFEQANNFVRNIVSDGGKVLFVGTKKQAQGIVAEEATRCEMPYVNTRWLGGTLTNFSTIRSRVNYLLELKKLEEEGHMELLSKKEAKTLRREIQKLEHMIGGIVNMQRYPSAVFVVDSQKEYIAVREAKTLGIPIVGVVDTNCNPKDVDYIIPSNDDAIRAIKLFVSKIADACIEGNHIYEQKLMSGVIEKPKEEETKVVVERKVFVFKEYGEDKDQEEESISVAISEGSDSKESSENKEKSQEDA